MAQPLASAGEKEEIIVDHSHGKRYAKGKFLGKGSFAKAFELRDVDTGVLYAGKIVPKSVLVKPYMKEKMSMEIQIHRSVRQRYVVGFESYFEDDENIYIVLELCKRRSLKELQKRRKFLTEPEVRYFTKQIVEGVSYLHKQNVIHRDLKLGNLFLSNELDIKIGDFGLATRIGFEGERKTTMCGTPNYVAPEVLKHKGHSYEVDVWAIGCIMYVLLVGHPPFEMDTLKETFCRIRSNKYNIPNQVSPAAQSLIVRMLHPDPSGRPSPDEILKDPFFTEGFCPQRLPISSLTMPPRYEQEALPSTTALKRPLQENNTPAAAPAGVKKETTQGAYAQTVSFPQSETKDVATEPSCEVFLEELLAQVNSVLSSEPTKKSPAHFDDAEDPAVCPVFWVGKWVDYSDKYGFGYTLCDSSAGVLFNDSTRMLLAANDTSVQYVDRTGNEAFVTTEKYPEAMKKKITLLKYFRNYMNQHLLRAGAAKVPESYENSRLPMLNTWFRTRSAIVLQLTNGILQINFFADHTKLILCPRMQAVTFIDEDRSFRTFRFSLVETHGCSEALWTRLGYAKSTIQRMLSKPAGTAAAS
ncbi:serine/threonine-protein kinase PLK1-like [Sycon ciliatum]|uniref:serine/threonine-protein kinase PLK1-like n=1 Tax=Sycon ciliatum TaxID=27933 RepID=UPI0020AB3210|eukprot:scpid40043/ scgid32692/ Serine/threonine-protein kinase PLK1; Polo-like kinase 1; Serine/threonine-protein kinase 13